MTNKFYITLLINWDSLAICYPMSYSTVNISNTRNFAVQYSWESFSLLASDFFASANTQLVLLKSQFENNCHGNGDLRQHVVGI